MSSRAIAMIVPCCVVHFERNDREVGAGGFPNPGPHHRTSFPRSPRDQLVHLAGSGARVESELASYLLPLPRAAAE